MGEGIPVDPGQLRHIVELRAEREPAALGLPWLPRDDARGGGPGEATSARPDRDERRSLPAPSFIPGPPPVPSVAGFAAYSPQPGGPDASGVMAALRSATSRDEVLELLLTGARMAALKVALFVVKRGGYLGWTCTPEFGERTALQSVLVPLDARSVFDEAVHDGLYLGPLRHDGVHAALLYVMRGASRDVALVPVRVTGKTAVVIVADDLGDTMLGTRRLEELAGAAGEAFTRIVRNRAEGR